ncbi:MAG: metal-dependent hydrolase [Methanobacterium sp.]
MPSYKTHALFSIIIALPFIHDVFYLGVAVIGASIIDMDHHVKKNNLIIMAIFGVISSFILYTLKLPFLFGISLIIMAFIFYISNHRGFTHSIFGVPLLSFLLAFFVLGLNSLLIVFGIENKLSLILISIILGIIILNKRIIIPFLIVVSIGIILMYNTSINPYYTFLAIFLGILSHIMLDLFTPGGIRLFNPIFSKKFYKSSGIIILISWILGAILFNFQEIIPFY